MSELAQLIAKVLRRWNVEHLDLDKVAMEVAEAIRSTNRRAPSAEQQSTPFQRSFERVSAKTQIAQAAAGIVDEQQQQEPAADERLGNLIALWNQGVAQSNDLCQLIDLLLKERRPYTHQQPQAQGEPVATLHSDGYWVWKGSAPPESNYAGWKMEVYAQPRAAVPDGWDGNRYGYSMLFNAIAAATNIQAGAIGISVKAFEDAMCAAAPAQPGDAQGGEG